MSQFLKGIFVMEEKHPFSSLSVATAMQTMVAAQSIIMTSEALHAEIQSNNQTVVRWGRAQKITEMWPLYY